MNGLAVLIRETFRSKRFKNQASFLENSDSVLTNNLITSIDDSQEGDSETDEEGAEEQ